MKKILDDESIDIPCENCSSETPKTIGWLKTNSQFICSCGAVIEIDSDDLIREIKTIERSIADLEKTFRNTFK